MSKIEGQVFTDKLEAFRHARSAAGKFFETSGVVDTDKQPLYVVAVGEHQAKLSLVEFLMPLVKWDRKKVNEQYIVALEDEMDKSE